MLALVIVFCLQAVSASYSEHLEYLSKLVNPVSGLSPEFNQLDLDQESIAWLNQLDKQLDPSKFGTYDASLLLNFDRAGYISAISLENLNEARIDDFSSLIAKLLTIQAGQLPKKIDTATVFRLDTSLLFVDRKLVRRSDTAAVRVVTPDLITSLPAAMELELIEPSYVDYPEIGELLVFKLKQDQYLKATVAAIDSKSLLLKLVSLEQGSNKEFDDVFLRIARPIKDKQELVATIIGSTMASALSAGILSSTMSYGIVPATLAVASMTSTLIKSKQQLLSFNLSRGDKVRTEGLTKGEKQ
ncbi:MAG: hypothetical protein HOA17_02690 [Candidatus Melainabacteria bacterium]|jgi:hypothetical protein|nr:hypothetical protein [Candidatus Melainabacteria bacterium]